MGAFIAVTERQWYCNQKENKQQRLVFWRKNKNFKAIIRGEHFYFYVKAHDKLRKIYGVALFEKFEKLTLDQVWSLYGKQIGFNTYNDFRECVCKLYGKHENMELGCIILTKPIWVDEGIRLECVNIDYSYGTVSGKTIDEDEDKRLFMAIIGGQI